MNREQITRSKSHESQFANHESQFKNYQSRVKKAPAFTGASGERPNFLPGVERCTFNHPGTDSVNHRRYGRAGYTSCGVDEDGCFRGIVITASHGHRANALFAEI